MEAELLQPLLSPPPWIRRIIFCCSMISVGTAFVLSVSLLSDPGYREQLWKAYEITKPLPGYERSFIDEYLWPYLMTSFSSWHTCS